MAATDARPVPRKNVAFRVTFPILDADGDLVTAAATLDSERSLDGAAFADCTNEATEIATGSGVYFLDLTAAEMNADTVAIIVKTGTAGAKTTVIVLYPEELGDSRADVTHWNGTAVTTPDIAGSPKVTVTSGTTAGLISLSAGLVDVTQAGADKVWASATRALTDKAGFALSAAGVQAIWDALTSALTVVGSIGKLLVDNINATISSRHASGAAVASVTNPVTVGTINVGAVDAVALATDAGQEIADRILNRSIAGGADGGRTVMSALRRLRNRVAIAAGVMTTYIENDITADHTSNITTAAGNPVIESDPV